MKEQNRRLRVYPNHLTIYIWFLRCRMVEYKKLPVERWREFKEIRLFALRKDWIAFGIAYEDEADFTEAEWKTKMKNIIFALDDDIIIGLVEYKFEVLTKMKHIAYINDLYVQKEYWGMGIGRALMEKAIFLIRQNKKIEKIKLVADPIQTRAIALYEKLGFVKTVLIKKELKYKGNYYDDLHMEKRIR